MNPYESPKTEPEPPEAQLAYHHPIWQRVLALGVPFMAGSLTLMGLLNFADGGRVIAAGYFALALGGLLVAWRWTR